MGWLYHVRSQEEHSRYLDTDAVPEDVLLGRAEVQLQLPTETSAWVHHLAETERYQRLVHPDRPAIGEQVREGALSPLATAAGDDGVH